MKAIVKEEYKNVFYYIRPEILFISDPELCQKSDRTFDMSFFDLANNENLLDVLLLYYIQGNYGVKYNYQSRARWFCGYLSAFFSINGNRYEKSLTNPTVRICIIDEELFVKVKAILLKNEN